MAIRKYRVRLGLKLALTARILSEAGFKPGDYVEIIIGEGEIIVRKASEPSPL